MSLADINWVARRKISEARTVQGRAKRYQKKLILEALNKAKLQGPSVCLWLPTVPGTPPPGDVEVDMVVAPSRNEDFLPDDLDPLIDLVKGDFPSLYRKYHAELDKHGDILIDLFRLSKQFDQYAADNKSNRPAPDKNHRHLMNRILGRLRQRRDHLRHLHFRNIWQSKRKEGLENVSVPSR